VELVALKQLDVSGWNKKIKTLETLANTNINSQDAVNAKIPGVKSPAKK